MKDIASATKITQASYESAEEFGQMLLQPPRIQQEPW